MGLFDSDIFSAQYFSVNKNDNGDLQTVARKSSYTVRKAAKNNIEKKSIWIVYMQCSLDTRGTIC